ncbi:MAG TPA: hypothetical protein VN922_17830, partial [Bacteroidia bacterium]|nr:hypothetical protein [Bacteroidia bacterium]
MKKYIYLPILLLILFAGKSNAQCNTWVPLQTDDTIQPSFGSSSYTSVAEAAITGAILSYHYVVYSDGMKGGKATVVYPPSTTTWTYLGTEGFSAGQAKYTTIGMGHTQPYVAYQDMANGGKATVMTYTGGIWKVLGAAGFSKGIANYDCIAVSRHKAGSDSIYVAYSDGAHHNKLTVLKYSGSGTVWDTIGTSGFSPGAASYISLQLDTLSGTLYVAYSDSANGYKITAFKSTGGAWTVLGPSTGFSNAKCSFVSLNVANPGNIYVAYCDSVQSRKGMAMRYSGGTWAVYGGGPF